ncbi:MAG: RNase J family beta-CASP ribonuclease [Nanoarchaeota archaeon]|nr:RNase J family beta-CASP ribonuclease [Nanoarchaeota archaeon]
MLKIHTVGGFSEVGKNMAVLELDNDAFIFDEGFFLPPIVALEESERSEYSEKKLRGIKAIPNDTVIENLRNKVRAQFIGHAHLDHVGAVPFISDRYKAPIYGTPFTMAVLDSLLRDNEIILNNPIKTIQPNNSFYVQGKNEKYKVDFINMTHSTLQTSFIAVHTKKGVILYANDFKLDDNPILGLKPNYQKLKEIAKEGVHALIIDSLYSGSDRKTPSEKIARNLLEEVLLTIQNRDAGIIVTTFSSHIARLKSIVEFGKRLNREVVFLGRSLSKYSEAAQRTNQAPFLKDARILKYRRQVEKVLGQVEKNRKKYLVVCTGHQGEPGSILERISRGIMPLKINDYDNVIFSSSVIPTEINKQQFAVMEDKLKKRKARIFRDVHVSGHAGREDLRDMISLLSPQHIIPAHGGPDKTEPMMELASEMGYKSGKQCHLMGDGEVLEL